MTPTITRVSSGIPTGGQFAEHNRGESAVALALAQTQSGTYVDVERHDWLDRTYTESVNEATGFTDDEFATLTDNYMVAAVWATTDDSDDEGRELDEKFDRSNFTARSRERASDDLQAFLSDNRELVAKALATEGYGVDESGTVGKLAHDFWLTRTHSGSGFWDDTALDRETRDGLTEAAHKAGDLSITVISDTEIEFV